MTYRRRGREPPERTLAATLPVRTTPGAPVRLAGWIHRRRRLSGLAFVVVRDRSGTRPGRRPRPGDARRWSTTLTRGDDRRGGRPRQRERAGAGRRRDRRPRLHAPDRPGRDAAGRALATEARAIAADACSTTRQVTLAASALQQARWRLAAASLRGFRDDPRRRRLHRDPDARSWSSRRPSPARTCSSVDYFGRTAYLAQSPQFYKQMLVGIFERVYEVGPVFRAEPHDTVRHLAEYVSLDVELGFIDDHRDVIAVLRDVLAGMVAAVARTGRRRRRPARRPTCPTCPPRSRSCTSARRSRSPAHPPTSPTSRPRTSARSASGRRSEHGSDFVAVEGYPMAKRRVLHPSRPATRAGRTRST